MTTEQFVIAYEIALTLIVGYLLIVEYLDRAARNENLAEINQALARCLTAETNCTKYECKAAEHAAASRHAAGDAKKAKEHTQGLHDCIKPQLPTIEMPASHFAKVVTGRDGDTDEFVTAGQPQ
jgi:hypothetical protein